MNINTANKVQVGETTTNTTSQWQTYNNYKAEQGWECPRCGHINAPWIRQCDCRRSSTTYVQLDKITVNPCDDLWKTKITCDDNITYTQVAGGNSVTEAWANVPRTYTNSVKR